MKPNNRRDLRIPVVITAIGFLVILSSLQVNQKPSETEPLGVVDLVWDQTGFRVVTAGSTMGSAGAPAEAALMLFEKVPVNEADVELLQTIPGIGPELAARIVDTRTREGRFNNPEDLLKVAGIGMKRKELFQNRLHFE